MVLTRKKYLVFLLAIVPAVTIPLVYAGFSEETQESELLPCQERVNEMIEEAKNNDGVVISMDSYKEMMKIYTDCSKQIEAIDDGI